jgi:SAM-dependent methyltransferase
MAPAPESVVARELLTRPQRLANFVRRLVRKGKHLARRIARALGIGSSSLPVSPAGNDPAQIALNEVRDAIRHLRGEMTTQISFLAHDLAVETVQRMQELEARLRHLDSSLHSKLNAVETLAYESKNGVIHLDSSLNSRLNTFEFVHLPALLEQMHESAMLGLSLGKRGEQGATQRERPRPTARPDFDEVLSRARADFPAIFDLWRERLDTLSGDFDITKTGNAANSADLYSRLFKVFVEAHARGAVLDVGCGPFGKPFYLADYPSRLISGLEPLPSRAEQGGIDIVRGISEYLPWSDRAFDTVISATSLDHCLALDRSLDEMRRVLKADGTLLLWIGHIPGSPQFRPLAPDFKPADRFHLFHFDIAWFEPMLEADFAIEDRVKLDRTGYSHVFYCLRPLQ